LNVVGRKELGGVRDDGFITEAYIYLKLLRRTTVIKYSWKYVVG